MSKEISLSDVLKHNSKQDLWIIINNDVYDVSSYADEHPGGVENLLEFAGTDGTEAFEEVGHSDHAKKILRKFKIGTLPMNERNKTNLPCRPSPRSDYKVPSTPRAERRVQAIVVPRESSKLKWAIIALASAIVIGVVLKKYVAT